MGGPGPNSERRTARVRGRQPASLNTTPRPTVYLWTRTTTPCYDRPGFPRRGAYRMRLVARALVLFAALALALPPRWCCVAARVVGCPEFGFVRSATTATATSPCGSVCHGHCPFRARHAARPPSAPCPRPCPSPSNPCYWLCVDRVATQPRPGPEAPGLDLAMPTPLPSVAVLCPRSQLALATGRPEAPAPDPPPLHVLHCSWLC